VYRQLKSRLTGLTRPEAEARLSEHGPNTVAADGRKSIALLLWHAVTNPLVLLLAVLAAISFSTSDARAGIVMSLMIVLGVGLRLICGVWLLGVPEAAASEYGRLLRKSPVGCRLALRRPARE
jgi:magnesium-transporting ATPase (P-type)